MAQQHLVQIDLERVRTNFEQTERRTWTEAEVRGWLASSSFLQHEKGWICEEDALTLLDECEILAVQNFA